MVQKKENQENDEKTAEDRNPQCALARHEITLIAG